jgi:ligand-binding sensor domain-containing protein
MRILGLLLLLLLVPLSGSFGAVNLNEQAITYADFSYINYVTASIKRVYFATTNGIIIYNIDDAAWDDPLTLPPDLDRNIRRVWVDTFDSHLYVETDVITYEYDIDLETWFPIMEIPSLDNSISHLRVPNSLLPPFGFNINAEGDIIDQFGRSFAVTDVLDGKAGTLWMGTWGYGPARAGSVSQVVDLMPYGLLQNRVNTLFLDYDTLFVSGAALDDPRTGISAFNLADNSFSYIETGVTSRFPPVDINVLDGDEMYLYAGTPFGLFRIDRQSRQVRDQLDKRYGLNDNNVLSLQPLGDSLFVGTYRGLTLYSFATDSMKYVAPQTLANEAIFDMLRIGEYLWLATSHGLYRLSLTDGSLQRLNDPSGSTFGNVYALDRNEKALWAATDDGAVRIDFATGDVESFPSLLYNRGSRALAVNDRIAALSSDNGIIFIFHDLKKPYTREITVNDGLPSPYVYSLVMDGDFIWVGTDKGLTRFLWNNPDRVD